MKKTVKPKKVKHIRDLPSHNLRTICINQDRTISGKDFLEQFKSASTFPRDPEKRWPPLKVARYSFSKSIPPKFERKLRRHKQRFGKIDSTDILDKDENLL